jgi:hypothetical protein
MLTQTERARIETALAVTLAAEIDPRGFLANLFSASIAQPLLLALPTSLTRPQDYAVFVIDYCLQSRWSQVPSMLERVLSRLTMAGLGDLGTIHQRVRDGIDPNPDIYMSRWILARQPFFARPDLRRFARQLIESNERPVLCVNGPSGSGRAYTRRFFEYLMEQTAFDLHVVYHEVPPATGPSTEADEIAATLTAPMRGAAEPPGRTSSSYPSALSRYVLRNAMQQPGKWIFALKGIAQEKINPEVVELVQLLGKAISTGEYRKKLRLVLIDHPMPIPPLLSADVMEEKIPATTVCAGDIIDCLVAYNVDRQAAGHPPIDQNALPTVAEGILSAAPAHGKARLQFVYDELLKLTMMPAQV